MRCADIMSPTIITCPLDTTLRDCARVMRDQNIGFMPVVDADDHLLGVVTDRDIVVRAIAEGRDLGTGVGDVMTTDLVTCRPDDDLDVVERTMASAQKSRTVVVDDDNKPVGVISLSTLAQVDEPERAATVLRAVTEREAPHRL